jgi:hypothetical protein
MPINTPNMNIPNPIVGQDSGLVWEQSVNAGNTVIDGHNHTVGNGVPIPPSGLNINAALPFNNQQATDLQAVVFNPQTGVSIPYAIYSIGVDLYFTDGSGTVVKLTTGGKVNATASEIVDGSATASFVSSVLVVNEASNTPANIQAGSVLFGNNTSGSFYVTVQPVSGLGASYSLTLPQLPLVKSIMALDASGNISAPYTVDGSTIAISSNIIGVPAGGITATQIANGTITGTQVGTNINLPGLSVQAGGHNVVVANTNNSVSLSIVRATISGTSVTHGEGVSAVTNPSTGVFTVTFSTAFADTPVVVGSSQFATAPTQGLTVNPYSVSTTGFSCVVYRSDNQVGQNVPWSFTAIGQL